MELNTVGFFLESPYTVDVTGCNCVAKNPISENRPFASPKRERIVFQACIFRCDLLVSGSFFKITYDGNLLLKSTRQTLQPNGKISPEALLATDQSSHRVSPPQLILGRFVLGEDPAFQDVNDVVTLLFVQFQSIFVTIWSININKYIVKNDINKYIVATCYTNQAFHCGWYNLFKHVYIYIYV